LYLQSASLAQCQQWETELAADYQAHKDRQLNLDITRGKPSSEQLNLSDSLDGLLEGNYWVADGTDTRNYGGLDGLPEAKKLGIEVRTAQANSKRARPIRQRSR